MPDSTNVVFLEGCGHWTQTERPREVKEPLMEFPAGLTA
jgi:pimeloyl-ACP methyl ester carboxylesterase